MTELASKTNGFLEPFDGVVERLGGPDWVRGLRRDALARFESIGFPTKRDEAWKQTSVAPITRTRFVPASAAGVPDLPATAQLGLGGARLVFVDGRHVAELSEGTADSGVWFGNLAAALETIPDRLREPLTRRGVERIGAFAALNTALLEDGAVVLVPDGLQCEAPLEVIHLSTGAEQPTACMPRTLIVAGRGSRVTVVESYVGSGGVYLNSSVSDIVVGDNAIVDHYRVQHESEGAYHMSSVESHQGRDSRYSSHCFDLGGKLVRHELRSILDGEGAHCDLNGLYLTGGTQHVDHYTLLDHVKPHCDSRELYKGILTDKSRSVFSGRIIVRQAAQKTDAKQSNRNLLLSEGALAHTRPQLEIYADDVKCTHGATIGRLDEEALFYLRSRAVPADAARNLLVNAFAREVLERIEVAPLKEQLEGWIAERLAVA